MQTIFLHASFKGTVLDSCYSLNPRNNGPHSLQMEPDLSKNEMLALLSEKDLQDLNIYPDQVSTWNKDFNRTLGIWGEQSFYSALLDIATLDKINDVLKRVGQKGRVEFGASNKLKWVDYGPDRLFNPHEHGKSTEGRIYESMIYGHMPDKDYKSAQSDVITPNNIDTFSVGNVLYAIYWLHDKKVDNS